MVQGGESWAVEGPILTSLPTPNDVRISLAADGQTLLGLGALIAKHQDDDSPEGELVHAGGGRHPMGYTNMQHVFCRSIDLGKVDARARGGGGRAARGVHYCSGEVRSEFITCACKNCFCGCSTVPYVYDCEMPL